MDLQPKLSLQRQLMGLSPKYNDLGLGRDMAWYDCLSIVLTEVALSKFCIIIFFSCFFFFFFFFLRNLCVTPTPAMMVRHDREQYREKGRKSENLGSLWHMCFFQMTRMLKI